MAGTLEDTKSLRFGVPSIDTKDMHRQLMIVALVAAGAQGCSGGGKAGPCESEICSGHGRCVPDGELATCQCDPGYRSVGTTCVADCFAVDCSGLGGCVVVDNEPVCVCDQGHEGVGLECRPAPETCHGISCSGHGGCVEIEGEPACICETGYAPFGLGCVPVSCTNVDCSDHGACVLRDGAWEAPIGTERVSRGGSLYNTEGNVRNAVRHHDDPDRDVSSLSFRCARDAP
jgi:hypothetical protein